MTQHFTADGTVIPVTRVVAGPCVIIQVKQEKKDGYSAIQVAFGQKSKINKPLQGHLKKLGNFQYLKEFRINQEQGKDLKVGDKITAQIFKDGDIVKVTGTSKGKGFQGVVRRHGFHGSPASHGHKDQLRHSGSIGAGGVQHVFKGMRMGGRMGGGQVTVSNLEVVKINPETNEIFIKGAVPGPRNNLLVIAGEGEILIEVVKKSEETNNVEVANQKSEQASGQAEDKKEEVKEKVEATK